MKRNQLKDLVKKAIVEAIQERDPSTLPQTQPKLSHDVQLFVNARKKVTEAINVGDYPDFIDPEKRAGIENEQDFVEHILPDLGPSADRYLEIITSEAYKKALDRAAHYLGTTVQQLQQAYPNMPTALGILMQTAKQVENLEKNSKPQLEKMAIDVVLSLDENKHIKTLIDSGRIILDVKLAPADLSKGVTDEEMDEMQANELTLEENLNAQIYSALQGESEGKLRRALANMLTQGDAINKFFLFNQVSEQLQAIDPTLPQKYGLLSATSLILNYWMPNHPFTRNFVDMAAAGSEEVVPTSDKYTIKVRGRNFTLLIHELVKGINEYLSLGIASQEELDTEKLSDEMRQFLVGPGLDLRLRQMIPHDKIEYIPFIKRLIYRLPIEQIKMLFMGGGKSQAIMKNIIWKAEQQIKDYQKSTEKEDEPPDFGGEEPNWR
jgi:hypothetical protein